MELIEQGEDDSNQGDFEPTQESKIKNRSKDLLHKMQPDLEEENSLDHLDQERRAEIALGYNIILEADQY